MSGVPVDEASHGMAELIGGIVQPDPQALVFEGADPTFGAAACLRLAQQRRAVGDAQPGQ